jgi:2-dehydropantoate 2-reductase
MRICIYGAGAIGGYLGAMLAEAGHAVSLVARGEHLKALRANGLTLEIGGRTLKSRPAASADPAELGPQDHVIVSVKAPALPSVVRSIAPLLGPETAVITALNGIPWWFFHGFGGAHDGRSLTSVDPDGTLGRSLEPRRIIGCVVHAGCSVPSPGVIRHASGDLFIIGEPAGGASARCQTLQQAIVDAGLRCDISPRIQQAVWMKLLGNMSMGPLSVLTNGTLAGMARDPGTRKVSADMMAEAIAVGRHFGLEPGMSIEERIDLGARLGEFKTSMLQDFEKGRPMELDTFLAAVVEMARLASVATPTIETVQALTLHKARQAGLYPAL